jgi:diguanylate cyclase (GGDEF)-like protein/PAS domain S-box-containing protein
VVAEVVAVAGNRSDLEILSVAVETADALIVVTDARGRILRFNPACERLTGWTAAEMVGRSAVALLAPGQRAEMIDESLALLAEGGSRRSVGRWITRDGDERTIAFTNTALRSPEGEAWGIVATGVDITEERRAVEALAVSERRHRALVEHSADVVVVIDPDGTLRYVSPSVELMLGWTPGELAGRNGFELVVEADRDLAAQSLAETLTELGPTVPSEFRVRGRDGRAVLVEAVGNNQLDDPAVTGVILHLRDLTERRTLEANLRSAEERFRRAFDQAPTGIVVTGLGGLILEVNPALAAILGRTEADLVGRNVADLTHPDDLPAALDYASRLVAGEIPGYRMEVRYLRPDGAAVWALLSVSPLEGADGRPEHLLAHIEDITERKSMTEELAHRAHHDGLTGLANRTAVRRRIDEALGRRHLHGVGVLFVDLDRFKQVNDRYGHEFGDQVLAVVGRRLTDAARATDLVGRVGGDEFVVVCEPASEAVIAWLIERVSEVLRRPIEVVGLPAVAVGATIGGVLAQAGDDTASVLRRADRDMYRRKSVSGDDPAR